jgi:phenylpyruvate tautomerase PptA (4-oxalocrotonate tautomerase family)
MPYLQLDLPHHYPLETKRALARRLGALYAEIMQTTPDLVDVGFRELGEGNVWRCGEGEPEPTAMMLLDIRRGRPPEQRARLAQALIDACVEALAIRADRFTLEFTQHPGDEAFRDVVVGGQRHGGFAPDWTPDEAQAAADPQPRT